MKEILLISQAARGNRKALEKLVRLYYEKIYNYIHSYVPTASFSAFLYRIAHNTVVDY